MSLAWFRASLSRPGWAGSGAFALYSAIAFLALGLPPLLHPGPDYVGTGSDPQVFIWAFAWWPHAIAHGLNPFVTRAVWAPTGVNLAWTTTTPGLALLFAPLTVVAGPVTSYNVAAVLMPALAAWAAFLLCRHLTRRLWPSLVGGYLFGFSSYMLGQEEGHLHVLAVFPLPLVALFAVRYVQGELNGRSLVVRLAPLIALEVTFATELAFTLTLTVVCSVALAVLLVPDRRRRLVRLVAPVAGSYLLAGILTSPLLYFLLTGLQTTAIHRPQDYTTDLLNFVIPTKLVLSAQGWSDSIPRKFPGNISEQGAYLGVPALLIVALFAWTARRTAGGRFLVASFLCAVIAALGPLPVVDGHRTLSLLWGRVQNLPLFDNVLTERLPLYVSLVAAVMVSLWAASPGRGRLLRLLLPALAILAIVPYPSAGNWYWPYAVPPLFTDSSYRACLAPGENVLPLPVNYNGNADLWQVESGFRFTMAGGYLSQNPPDAFLTPEAVRQIARGGPVPAGQAQKMVTYIHDKHVTSVLVDMSQTRYWAGALDRIATPHFVGGVLLYHVDGRTTGC